MLKIIYLPVTVEDPELTRLKNSYYTKARKKPGLPTGCSTQQRVWHYQQVAYNLMAKDFLELKRTSPDALDYEI